MIYRQDNDNVRRNLITVTMPDGVEYNAIISHAATPKDDPIIEPVTLQEVKDYSHIDLSDDDNKINNIITSVRQLVENYTGLYLIPVSVSATITNGLGNINLAGGNVSGVKDKDGVDVDLTNAVSDQMEVVYNAGYSTIPSGIKIIMLTAIDNVLNGKEALDNYVMQMLKMYKYA